MEALIKPATKETVGPSTVPGDHIDRLPIPHIDDSIDVLQAKLTALAAVVCRGQSIAILTNFAATSTQERDPVRIAVSEMPPDELRFWSLYTEGKYRLPKIDWDKNRDPVPTSKDPLRTARRRAEALNRLYKTDRADPSHAVWFTKNEALYLPLIKAMARVIGAERNLQGGQGVLDATQMADLRSINHILSVSAQISHGPVCKAIPQATQAIDSAHRILGSHRDMLRGRIAGSTSNKRK